MTSILLLDFARQRRWSTVLGYALFTGLMAVGYYYNITFIQLGLEDLGRRSIGIDEMAVGRAMALLAGTTCLVALAAGGWMTYSGASRRFRTKLRLAFVVVVVQTVLTAAVPAVGDERALWLWVLIASFALGIGIPATFGLTVDLVAVRDRGLVAAAVTAGAYLAAGTLPSAWRVDVFASQMLLVMPIGVIGLGVLVLERGGIVRRLVADWSRQHADPAFGRGRFVRDGAPVRRSFIAFLALMFGVYFIDSLGFLRIIDTPLFVESAWLADVAGPRLAIAGAHVLAAAIAGVLYYALDARTLFYWIFGLFGMVHLMYGFDLRLPPYESSPLATPLLYAVAVSLYTVVNFALWADLSSPRTIAWRSALGVAVSGWAATFLSTALALRWRVAGMPLERHLGNVEALALLFFVGMLGAALLGIGVDRGPTRPAVGDEQAA
jgi:hypothetical protein